MLMLIDLIWLYTCYRYQLMRFSNGPQLYGLLGSYYAVYWWIFYITAGEFIKSDRFWGSEDRLGHVYFLHEHFRDPGKIAKTFSLPFRKRCEIYFQEEILLSLNLATSFPCLAPPPHDPQCCDGSGYLWSSIRRNSVASLPSYGQVFRCSDSVVS